MGLYCHSLMYPQCLFSNGQFPHILQGCDFQYLTKNNHIQNNFQILYRKTLLSFCASTDMLI